MKGFRAYIERFTPVAADEWAAIEAAFEPIQLKRGAMLLREGQVCRHLYFLESGLLRYFILRDGVEYTKFFTVAPYCFTSQVSFTQAKPSSEHIQAIESCRIWQTTLPQANDLLALPSWNIFIRKLVQEVQSFTESILQDIQSETAESRYRRMLSTNPMLLQRVPLRYMASYLGIAPQSLSRIRKKISSTGGN